MSTSGKRALEQDPDESVLLRRLRAGDESAFELLVRAHRARLLTVARRMLGNEEDAKDALQEAFLSAARGVGRFSGRSRLSTWLHRILVNCCLMTLRQRRAKPQHLFAELPEPRVTRDAPVESAVEHEETVQAVRDGIDRLPEQHRNILMLREISGMDTRTAARSLHVSPNAVKARLYRAKQALRAELEPLFGLARAG